MKFDHVKLIEGIKTYIQTIIDPIQERVKSLENSGFDATQYIPLAEFNKRLNDAIDARLKAIPTPVDGRDAVHLEIMPEINQEKAYPRNSYAKHNGGLWRSFETTHGMKGWECIVDGVAGVQIEQTEERTISIKSVLSSGQAVEKAFTLPVILYKGVYTDNAKYHCGDTTTYGGSLWHCEKSDPEGKPGNSSDWKLAVKKGRDGKPGDLGKPGAPGKKGDPGRDLTQMGFDGRKY